MNERQRSHSTRTDVTGASIPGRPIRVLHLIHTVAYGGVETALINWLTGLDRSHVDARLVCLANPGATERPFVEAAQRAGLTVSTIRWGRHKPLWRAARELAAMVREQRIDIVHSHNWYADFICALAARMTRVRTITTLYVWFRFDWKRNLLQWIDQQVIRSFDRISAHCEATRHATIARGIPPERVQTLTCGFATHPAHLSPAERSAHRRALGAADSDIVLLNVARMYPEKAQAFLLRCYKRIVAVRPHARLWIAGIGPLEAELRELCAQLQLDQHVRFLGFVEELPTLMALADVQVHPANIEGVPLAICEGMAAGLPIVASDVGGLPEVIASGERGLLVPRADEEAFIAATLSLIDHREQARSFGERARAFMADEYSLAAAVDRLERTYAGMLDAAAPASLATASGKPGGR